MLLEGRQPVLLDVGHLDHPDQVDDAVEDVPHHDRDLQIGTGWAPEPLAHHPDRPEEVGPDPVHLVDEGDPRDPVLVGLAPDGLALGLDPADRAEDGDRAVEDPERPLDLDREVDVPGGVDQGDLVVVPIAGRGGRGDRDPPLALLLHPVHRGGAFVHLAHAVDLPREVEDPLAERGLARINMGHDADIADVL